MDYSNHIPYQGAREDMYKIFITRARELLDKFGAHIPDRELQELRLDVRTLSRDNFRFLQEWTGAPALAAVEKSEPNLSERTIQESNVLFGSKYTNRLSASVTLYHALHKTHRIRLVERRGGKPLFTIGAMFDLTSAMYECTPQERDRTLAALRILEKFILTWGNESMKQIIPARQRRAALEGQMKKTISPLKALMDEQEARVSACEENHTAEYTSHVEEVRTSLYQQVITLISLEEVKSALTFMQDALRLDAFALSLIEEGARHESVESAALWDERDLFAIAMDNAGREYEAHAQDIRDASSSRSRRKTRLKDEEDARSYQEQARVCYEIAHALREGDLAALLDRELDALASTQNGQDPSLKERRDALFTVSELAKQNIRDAIAFAFQSGIVTSEAQAYALTLAPLLRQ